MANHHADIPNRIQARDVAHPGTWIAAVIVTMLALVFVQGLVTNPNYQWPVVWLYLRDVKVITGIGYTIVLTFAAMLLGTAVALLMAMMRQSRNPVLRGVSRAYIFVFRGVPVYTQLVFWGLLAVLYPTLSIGVPFSGPQLASIETKKVVTALAAAIIGLGLNEGAYLAEIIRSGLESVDAGQSEAAKALGMKPSLIMRRVIIPQAMRVIIPPLGNETIGMLKTTSLVLAVPFTLDLQYATSAIANRIYAPIPLLIVAAFWYLVVTSVLMIGQHFLEHYFGRGFNGQSSSKRLHRQAAIQAAGTTHKNIALEVEQ
ncbi:amino acid ABC transporter permease [Cutibacterium acnes]|nr:ABC transporter, permease protein [Cutibacterium acnes HL097PA1]EIA12513.1 ABC transporter permease [Cutibacterium acnes PRP-38]REB18858.1 amino acid ABC transporter permease [Cutibacterium acnes]TLG25028.1 amino acid ABC transporter permease [Cutibacterium acnes]TMT62913.1 amino acid ABC transporter permease [Cutibacterium acnes]